MNFLETVNGAHFSIKTFLFIPNSIKWPILSFSLTESISDAYLDFLILLGRIWVKTECPTQNYNYLVDIGKLFIAVLLIGNALLFMISETIKYLGKLINQFYLGKLVSQVKFLGNLSENLNHLLSRSNWSMVNRIQLWEAVSAGFNFSGMQDHCEGLIVVTVFINDFLKISKFVIFWYPKEVQLSKLSKSANYWEEYSALLEFILKIYCLKGENNFCRGILSVFNDDSRALYLTNFKNIVSACLSHHRKNITEEVSELALQKICIVQ